jgi:hypothetical protein
MISYKEIETTGFEVVGFEVSTPTPFEVVVGDGQLNLLEKDGSKISHTFEAFAFDVEPDPDFPVVYDVHLVDGEENIQVDRTVFTEGNVAFYEGEEPLLHTLTSFIVPVGANSLEDVNIEVRRVKLIEKTQSEEQRPQPVPKTKVEGEEK